MNTHKPNKAATESTDTMDRSADLLDDGGIVGGDGFSFQNRYIACSLPTWMQDVSLMQILHEGTGDVDLRFGIAGQETRHHVQVKDHNVTQAEFKRVVEHFAIVDKGMPGIYQRFTLACPSLSQSLHPLKNTLDRFRGASAFFESTPAALDDLRSELRQRVAALGLATHADLIADKLHFDINLHAFHDDDTTADTFVGRLLNLAEHAERRRVDVEQAYPMLLIMIDSSRGKTLAVADIRSELIATVTGTSTSPTRIVVHNWTHEEYEPRPDHPPLDWTKHFDRAARRTPTPDVWQNKLLPHLDFLAEQIRSKTASRRLSVRGKMCLSTGIALGFAFPEPGGWTIDVDQPPNDQVWRSSAPVDLNYAIGNQISEDDHTSNALGVIVNITGVANDQVEQFLTASGTQIRALAVLTLPGGPGARRLTNDSEAMSFVTAARTALQMALSTYGVRETHMFYFGPISAAVFLGQRLTSLGTIKLYEFQNPGYAPSCTLRTG